VNKHEEFKIQFPSLKKLMHFTVIS